MHITETNSTPTSLGYTPASAQKSQAIQTGKSSKGQNVEVAVPTPVLTLPEVQEASPSSAHRKKASIGQRLACPFSTAGNHFVKTAYTTSELSSLVASLPGALAGVVVGAVVSAPVAAVVKLFEMVTGAKTGFGGKVLSGGCYLGECLGAGVMEQLGRSLGAIAGVGLGIAAGVIGFGKGIRDAVTGDVDRAIREKSTLKDFFGYMEEAKEEQKELQRAAAEQFQTTEKPDKASELLSSGVALPLPGSDVNRDDRELKSRKPLK